LTAFFLLLTTAGWLVPNHYVPWLTAWGDGLAIVGLLLLLVSVVWWSAARSPVSWKLVAIAVVCYGTIWTQLASGKLLFAGDAWMAMLYIGVWLGAVLAGGLMATATDQSAILNALAAAWLLAALLSVGIALMQWTGVQSFTIFMADLSPGGRPFANVAQPNHLSTLCFLGLCGLLWLRQLQRVKAAIFWLAVFFLLLGMVVSQSRTGWLQIWLLVMWGLAMQVRANLRINRAQLLTLGAMFMVGTLLWPWICDVLLLSVGRSLDDQMTAGVRLPYWWAMLDAIGREPLWGYGWQQAGAAQQRIAFDHQIFGSLFDHSHNFLIDLLLWNGIPIGGFIITILAWWFIAHIHACHDARIVWLLAAVIGVFTHGMLEFPLEYAYFLIPVGLAMGAIDSFSPETGPSLRVPRWSALLFTALLGAVFVWAAAEYLKVEENYRTQRLEMARIGVPGIVTPAPKLRLLTQMEAVLQVAHTEPKPGMSADEMAWLRKVASRIGYASVISRYALALALNGNPDEAKRQILLIRQMFGQNAYEGVKRHFNDLANTKYPELRRLTLPQ